MMQGLPSHLDCEDLGGVSVDKSIEYRNFCIEIVGTSRRHRLIRNKSKHKDGTYMGTWMFLMLCTPDRRWWMDEYKKEQKDKKRDHDRVTMLARRWVSDNLVRDEDRVIRFEQDRWLYLQDSDPSRVSEIDMSHYFLAQALNSQQITFRFSASDVAMVVGNLD